MAYRDDYEALQHRVTILEREVAAARQLEREVSELREENARLRAELRELRPDPVAHSAPKPELDPVEDLFQSYLQAVGTLGTNKTGLTEDEVALVRKVEETHGVPAAEREKFRTSLLNYQGALRIEGRPVVCRQLFPELHRDLSKLLEG